MISVANQLVSEENLEKASSVLRAFAHPLRLRILKFISENDRTSVNKIYSMLQLEQSITSQHLRVLRDAGLVLTVRSGKFIFYSLNYDTITSVSEAVQTFLNS